MGEGRSQESGVRSQEERGIIEEVGAKFCKNDFSAIIVPKY
ncbi:MULTISPECIES: hypothetical protein [unclassified Okeania]|nr:MULTISPECIES: hypothetical protein [unclassified Okeania]